MKMMSSRSLLILFGAVVLCSCGSKEAERAQPTPAPQSAAQKAEPAPAPAEAAPHAEKAAPAKPRESAPAPVPAEKPAPAAAGAQASVKDVVILKAALGGVRFEHQGHVQTHKVACEACHHASRPEQPASAAQQACGACHLAAAVPPMKTRRQAAFHNPTATAGTCIDCHKMQNAKGQSAPVKCLDCHKKEVT